MLRRLPRPSIFVASLVLLAIGLQPIFAADYRIGPGQQYASLETLRVATLPGTTQLRNGDRIILYGDDYSLTDQLYIGENVGITIMSSDPDQRRTITPAVGAQTRFVYMDGNSWNWPYGVGPHNWSQLSLEGIEEISGFDSRGNGYSINGGTDAGGGGVIYAWWNQYIYTPDGQGVTFRNNFSDPGDDTGGGVVYYWDAIECNFMNSSFIDNKTTGFGGALYINASPSLALTNHTDVTIGASDGKVSTFSGNRDHVVVDPLTGAILNEGVANSIDFTGSEGNTANLFIVTEGTGVLDMQDPFRTNAGYGDYKVNIIKTGQGTWKLGGRSVTADSGGTIIDIREGVLEFYQGASLNALGGNDEFRVVSGASVLVSGNNTITGTTVVFSPGSNLSFDFNYYYAGGAPTSTPMLNLSGNTLVVRGVRIDVANVPFELVQPGRYALIQGNEPMTVGDYDLWIGDVSINQISDRYGYRLNYENPLQLALDVTGTQNRVLTWRNHLGTDQWDFVDQNWDLTNYKESTDSFIPGDSVVFSLVGDNTVTLGTLMQFAPQGNEPGMRVSGTGNWTFRGGSFGDLYNPGVFDKKGAFVFDGSGSVTLKNDAANTHHGTIISGGGLLTVSRGDQLGNGGVFFQNNKDNRLTFDATTALGQQVTVEAGAHGTLTAAARTSLTVTVADSPAILVKAGGELALEGYIRFANSNWSALDIVGTVTADGTRFENNGGGVVELAGNGVFDGSTLYFYGNNTNLGEAVFHQQGNSTAKIQDSQFIANRSASGGAVVVEAGKFTANDTLFERNQAQSGGGGALTMSGGTVDLRDSNFRSNTVTGFGGAIGYQAATGSSLTLGATDGKTSQFSDNRDSSGANSVAFSGAADIRIVTEGTGVLDMQDPMSGLTGSNNAKITKSGTGTWLLGGDSGVVGNNTLFKIEAGKLELYKNATISVGNGTFTIDANGTLAVQGGNGVSARTISFANGATLAFDLTGYDPNNIVLLDLAATNWSVSGTQYINVVSSDGLKFNESYNLVTASGTDLNTMNMELLYNGESVSAMRELFGGLNVVGSTLQVVLDNDPNKVAYEILTEWTNNSGDGIWNATSLNWKGLTPGMEKTEQFLHRDAAVFGDTGAGTITVNTGGVIIARYDDNNPGMTVNNSANKEYIFDGGAINGEGGLLKTGEGSVTFLQKENGFKGGTTIEKGTVVATSVKSLGTGDITNDDVLEFDLAQENSGTFGIIYKRDASGQPVVDYEQRITGTGSVRKSGNGDLTLNNPNNNYSGNTEIRGGKLIAASLAVLGGNVGDIDTGVGDEKGAIVFDFQESDGEIGPAQTIYGTGSVLKSGSKTLILSGINSYEGGTIITDGRLTATSLDALGVGGIVNHGELEFRLNDKNEVLDRRIEGTGNVIKSGGKKLSITNGLALQNSTLNILGGTFGFETLTRATLGGLSGTEDIVLTNDNALAVALMLGNNGRVADYSGNLSGKGSLTKIGSGTQTLSGTNSYAGGTVIEEGRLVAVGLDALGPGYVSTNAELELRIIGYETLDRVISGTGSIDKSGGGTLVIDTQQDYTGGTTVSDGTLKINSFDILGTGPVNVQSKGSLNVNVAKDIELAPNVSIVGNLTKTGDGVLTINHNASLTGTINVSNGDLFVNGNVKAATTMAWGTTLGGKGGIDNTVTLKNGATQVVGAQGTVGQNSFTARDFVYEGGSTIYVKVGKYDSDRIIAEKGFDFAKGGGTVNVIFLSINDFDNEEITTQYDVFSAEKGQLALNGTRIDDHSSVSSVLAIDGVQGNVQFLAGDGELDVIGYEVKTEGRSQMIGVNVLATGGIAYSYLTENQRAVLGGIGSAAMYDQFFKTSKEFRGDFLNELTPALYTAMPLVSQRGVTQYNLATFERLRFLREPLGLDESQESDYRGSSYRLTHRHGHQNYLWFQNFGDFLRTESDDHCSGIYADGYGFSVGVDHGVDVNTVLGFGMGGYFAKARATDLPQSGKANSFLLSVYGQRIFCDDWALTGSGGFSFNRYSIDRVAPSFGTTLSSGHNGTAMYVAFELTRKILLNKLEVSPYLDVNWIWLCEAGSTERSNGDPDLALRIDSRNTSSLLPTVGVRFGRSFRMLEKNIVNPSFYVGWTQDWGNGRIRSTAAFPGEPMFTIRGASMRNNRAVLGLNLNMTLNNRTDVFARFNSELADRYSDLSFHWGLRLGF